MQQKQPQALATPQARGHPPKNKIHHMSLIRPSVEPEARCSLLTAPNGMNESEQGGTGVKKLLADLFNMRSNMRELQENNQRMVEKIQRTYQKSREGRNDMTNPLDMKLLALPIKDMRFNT